ncbi:hypothetical protein SUGI_1105260 [Cryptomeria japonica]|uniref:fructose-bisphosphate aldolase-lysine N-methyltransferase, chloroplastic n=1 Tax=Cryptomeria japonica TaxID=3369 RepID=UPI002414AC26|nr:fructose-bisphosphate aldolase-lysine N-methyltransferase, chloroplastic [Cryptomeria japonica]GLJ51996.1 hypothetical protein SUGI_1105260 [Cryptomeria japonica]
MAILSTSLFSTCGYLQNNKFSHLQPSLSTTSVKTCNTRALSVNSANRGLKVASKDDIQYFWQWLSDEGGISSSSTSVKPEIVPQRLGLVAQRNISQGEVVLEVPKKIWISMDTVYASEIGKLCQGLRPWVAISLFLLREKSKLNSPWRPYLNILPETLDSPMFWSEEELAELQGTQLLSSTLGYKDYVGNEFLKVQDEVIAPNRHLFDSDITEEDFLWAFGILRSRAFLPLTGDNLALVPFADLVNHGFNIAAEEPSWERRGSGLFNRQEALSMKAPAAFMAGEQVFMQYGRNKSNSQLALDYGIVERNAINDPNRNIFTLTLEISESDPFFADKLDIAELNGMQTTMYFDIAQGQDLPESMLTFLRLMALGGTDAFLLEALFRDSVWGHLSLPVSEANEATICKVILDGCQSALGGYATTIEEDKALLGQQLEPRLEIAVVTRLGEKRVLREIQSSFEGYRAQLDQLEYYQEKRLKDLGLCGELGDVIFWES